MPRVDEPDQLIGRSSHIRSLKEEIGRVAPSDAKILLTGESGVGKDLVARRIHVNSPRARQPFVPVNCGGLPETLLESELFGHVRGSFTGAYRDRPGKLKLADQGTLFLDEIEAMSLHMQALLLRFLETGELQQVGADHAVGFSDVRVIAATNGIPEELVREGRFRQDLYYRLNVIRLEILPLRERPEDVEPLVEHFLARHAGNGHVVRHLAPEVTSVLRGYGWPGNVRELENVVERLVVRTRSEVATVEDLPDEIRRGSGSTGFRGRGSSGVTDDLYRRLTEDGESFWSAVYPLYMSREITKSHLRELLRKGLGEARGNYKLVVQLFNMETGDYKRFLNFLRNHDCQLPFKEYRKGGI